MPDQEPVLTIVACGAGPAADLGSFVKEALSRGWTVQVVTTPSALAFFDAGEVEKLTAGAVFSYATRHAGSVSHASCRWATRPT